MNQIIYGEPLLEVSGELKDKKPKIAIMFVIDGCRADTLYNALENGSMPQLKSFMEEVGHIKYENCFTVFPSVTITCHSSIVTGTYPGYHGIVGNDWFIRKRWGIVPDEEKDRRDELYKVTREYVKYSWRHPFSDPGLANGLLTGNFFGIANSDLYHQIKTIYEGYNKFIGSNHDNVRSMSIFEMITRSVDDSKFIDIDDVGGLGGGKLLRMKNWLKSKFTKKRYFSFSNKGLDRRAFDELLDELDEKERKRPELLVVWLPGMDGFSHQYGASYQPEFFKDKGKFTELLVGNMDEEFGKLRHRLKKENLIDDALIAITADHGQYDCSDKLAISNEMLYHYLKFDSIVEKGEIFPLTDYGKVDNNCKDASVIIIANGGACYIYIKSEEGWSKPPTIKRMQKFLEPLERFMGTDKIFVRYSDKEYKLWENDEYLEIDSLDSNEYPFAKERINNLSNTLRSGDIILSTKKPFYYAGNFMRGEHGSLHREDSHVPLLFINKNLNSKSVSQNIRTIDISPTIAESMGFLNELREVGSRKDKLSAILDTLEKNLNSKFYKDGLEKTLNKIDSFSEENRVKREWEVEEFDMRTNFEIKVKKFLEEEEITQDEYNELVARYKQVTEARNTH